MSVYMVQIFLHGSFEKTINEKCQRQIHCYMHIIDSILAKFLHDKEIKLMSFIIRKPA